MPLFTRENVIQDKKAVTTLTTITEFLGSVFAKTISVIPILCKSGSFSLYQEATTEEPVSSIRLPYGFERVRTT